MWCSICGSTKLVRKVYGKASGKAEFLCRECRKELGRDFTDIPFDDLYSTSYEYDNDYIDDTYMEDYD